MSFTAREISDIQFDNAPFGRRGYAKAEVDAFVSRIALTLAGKDTVTAAEVHHVRFGRPLLGRRGYDEEQVDEFLDLVERQLAQSSGLRPASATAEGLDR
ncbi:DivIVA domain-containing protein [Saccharomonospora xinjiangensis]|uniref:Cell wall synthesis protein Wag31 n=1 Tax=Saccharomonospora xinjiangensis XJ-54 TaxID=882086 RepID=I0V4P4_9PSEU|nr:DivIVA domain-containing protein [Saccharomonospora xinjiangensis]EID55097.1 DivIVA domain protein [Saccharomonospora xinjiangensis XJ-54]